MLVVVLFSGYEQMVFQIFIFYIGTVDLVLWTRYSVD